VEPEAIWTYRIREKPVDPFGIRTADRPACSLVPKVKGFKSVTFLQHGWTNISIRKSYGAIGKNCLRSLVLPSLILRSSSVPVSYDAVSTAQLKHLSCNYKI
jgi:hypothetical protein